MMKDFDSRYYMVETADESSPYRKYMMAQMQLEIAVSKGKLGQFMTAFFYVRRGYNLLLENKKQFPAFVPNLIGLGLFHALIGTVPQKYMWGVNMMGFYGNLEEGMAELWKVKQYAEKTPLYCKEELDFIYVYGLLYMLNDKKAAWDRTKILIANNTDNLLYTFLGATVAFAVNNNEEALKILQNRPKGPDYIRFSYLDYMLGLAKLRRLDKDASFYFEKFLLDKEHRNFVKDAYQKLTWCYLLNGNMPAYKQALADGAARGNTVVDADKQAQRELDNKEIPNLILLRARLLCDGGYYERAIAEFAGKKMDDFPIIREKVEFMYRSGRIYHEWGFPDKAIPYYLLAVKFGANLPQWFEASSDVNLGLIYEQKGNLALAKVYYQKCIDSKNTDYKNGLEQKARSGLERLKKKK
jgi:tetratricopeptide (TPR) repeat protein